MRSSVCTWFPLAAVAGCAVGPADTNEPLSRACERTNCFFERNVRDYSAIDSTTMIVYVGAQRCPFLVQLDGMFCDVTFLPGAELRGRDGRICSFDRGEVDAGVFGQREGSCRIRDVRSLTDDELVELLVDRGVLAPPPPVGRGEIRVGGRDEPAANGGSTDGLAGQGPQEEGAAADERTEQGAEEEHTQQGAAQPQ